jgi:bifunctional pyridoxal-dependent enzyme with beta-cystathionase and maltose regulon repressor activities
MSKEEIIKQLQKLTGHKLVEVVLRGNSAIDSALNLLSKNQIVLIPEEGGWIHYQKAPKKLELKHLEVKCVDAKIDLEDLKDKLSQNDCGAFLYQNPGGYFAEQPMREMYELCKKNGC